MNLMNRVQIFVITLRLQQSKSYAILRADAFFENFKKTTARPNFNPKHWLCDSNITLNGEPLS